ncbi:hypothetical protein IC229_09030 [Spirosoma sp. BT702]|uniref:Uncharacterized protein n=1 Tax=Spirosoma profusum TaxID=2771354 RepID=A0A926XV59_9BACT|nr:hypothetical protein [Spirosoma profusum]MBD2700779.1 hypothetical protein [Spirosoma profusum]
MNTRTRFYRFFYWSFIPITLIALFVLLVQLVWGTESEVITVVYSTFNLLAGISLISLSGYVFVYGKSWAQGVVLSVVSLLVSWVVLEGVCGLILRWKEGPPISAAGFKKTGPVATKQTNFQLVHYDSLGMSRPAPGGYEISYAVDGQRSPDGKSHVIPVKYHIDSLSRRITPFSNTHPTGNYALFLGCSFTYGEAVSDTSTIPYFYGKQTGDRPYNYGVSGHSPAHALAILQTVNLRKEITEKTGVAFYTYIDDQLARVTPSSKWAYNSGGYLPSVNPASLVVDGTYAQRHPVRLRLINWMYKSNIAKLLKLNFPRRYTTEHYQHFVNIVRKIEIIYRKQLGNNNFYVVIFPAYPMDPELRRLFEEAHIKLLDYSHLLAWKTAPDGMHPDDEAYRRVAIKLAEDVSHRHK